ncbi:MAG: alkaline phosphatase family protein [Myxococcota bacterium]|nr:alkaline phosphatase family protein [Myxococcota bacterium]
MKIQSPAAIGILVAFVFACSPTAEETPTPPGRVLIVGLDGATQKVIAPLVEAGELPHFAALARNGTTASIRAPRPVLSPRIWTSVTTGQLPEQHGILDWVKKGPHGKLLLYSNLDRTGPALWNIASAAGKTVGVVNWLMTQPPDVINGVMVSDHAVPGMTASRLPMAKDVAVMRFGGANGKVHAPEIAIAYAHPEEWVERSAALRDASSSLTDEPNPFDGPEWQGHPIFDFLRGVYRDDELALRTALEVQEATSPDLMMVYFPGVDRTSHLLWQGIEVPENPPPYIKIHPAKIRANHRRALLGYYRFTDALLGKLLEPYGPNDLVIVLSDHGFEASTLPNTMDGIHDSDDARDGILYMRGRGVSAGATAGRIAHVDIAPTVLAWLGLPVARDMPGSVATFVRTGSVATTPSYRSSVRVERVAAPASDVEGDIINQLRTLGYVE